MESNPNESLDVNQGSAATPVESSPTEETPTTQVETPTPEPEISSEPTPPDASDSEPSEESKRTVPYDRFAEVNQRAKVAEERANALEARLQGNVQPAPVNRWPSFNQSLGYPEDPKEYFDFVGEVAANRTRQENQQQQDNIALGELQSKYSEFIPKPGFVGAAIQIRQEALNSGKSMTYVQAAEVALKEFGMWKEAGREEARNGEVTKVAASVSKSQSKSSTTGSSVPKLTAIEFARLKPSEQKVRYPELLATYSEE